MFFDNRRNRDDVDVNVEADVDVDDDSETSVDAEGREEDAFHPQMLDQSSYTDDDLLTLVGFDAKFPPSDRALEARLIQLVRVYQNDGNVMMQRFFVQAYHRLFGEDDAGNTVVEGLDQMETEIGTGTETGTETGTGTGLITEPAPRLQPRTSLQPMAGRGTVGIPAAPTATGGSVTILDFPQGNVNPLLKNTYTKLLYIDSTCRDSSFPNSTDFVATFSEVLRGVVRLRLYSVVIPFHWYTISAAYGSNFFVLRGNRPGIDTSDHDLRVQIAPGTYTAEELTSAIGSSMAALPTAYPEIEFGATGIQYSTTSAMADITVNLRNAFNETHYTASFGPDTVAAPDAADFVFPSDTVNRNTDLSAFLGFNESFEASGGGYKIGTAFSRPTTVDLFADSTKLTIHDDNRTVQIVQYVVDGLSLAAAATDGVPSYVDAGASRQATATATLVVPNGSYTHQSLVAEINHQMATNPKLLDAGCVLDFELASTDPRHELNNKYRFRWRVQMNRATTHSPPLAKLALVLPADPVWIAGSGTGLHFETEVVELCNLRAETALTSSDYVVPEDTFIRYACAVPEYAAAAPSIDVVVPSTGAGAGYTLTQYIQAIQTAIQATQAAHPARFIANNRASIDPVTSHFRLRVDLADTFPFANFVFTVASGHVLAAVCGIAEEDITEPVSATRVGEFTLNNFYEITETATVCSVQVSAAGAAAGIQPFAAPTYTGVPFVHRQGSTGSQQYTLAALQEQINESFQKFTDAQGARILKSSSVSFNAAVLGGNRVQATLVARVQRDLTELDYEVQFFEEGVSDAGVTDTSWRAYLKLDQVTYAATAEEVQSSQAFRTIEGTEAVDSDLLTLADPAFLRLAPDSWMPGVAGSGSLAIEVAAGQYSRQDLFRAMNAAFAANPVLAGTQVAVRTDALLLQDFCEIRWSVNKVFSAKDYSLVFYDSERFVACFIGNKSARNTRPTGTLGWILGFQSQTEYPLEPEFMVGADAAAGTVYEGTSNPYTYVVADPAAALSSTSTATTTADRAVLRGNTTVNVNIYNNFFITLDDFNQNHINDNVVTVAAPNFQFPLPSYANRRVYQCDPITSQRVQTGVSAVAQTGLTQKQLYSASQQINSQNSRFSLRQAENIYPTDVFASIPLKLGSTGVGQPYIEFSGTLQNQDRSYFGPINLRRFGVRLINDRGDTVDLNGQNWQMQILCEIMYNCQIKEIGNGGA